MTSYDYNIIYHKLPLWQKFNIKVIILLLPLSNLACKITKNVALLIAQKTNGINIVQLA